MQAAKCDITLENQGLAKALPYVFEIEIARVGKLIIGRKQ